MKYLFFLPILGALYASYKGWVFNADEFFINLQKDKPEDYDDVKIFMHEGNDIVVTENAAKKLVIKFSAFPVGMKSKKTLANKYRQVSPKKYVKN